jgi:Predicted hydrolases of HD superfamily
MNEDCIITYQKHRFSPLKAKSEDIDIVDIAHALSLLCRANGHIKHFYSVAQHCINCAGEAKARGLSVEIRLACLLHDASEAFISDITRPVKRNLPQYTTFEAVLQDLIYERFGLRHLTEEDFLMVGEIDDSLLYYEMLELMGEEVFANRPALISRPDFEQRDFIAVQQEFLDEYNRMIGSRRLFSAAAAAMEKRSVASKASQSPEGTFKEP